MTSALNTKINSYAIEKGIEFNYAYALPPTETGSLAQSLAADWSLISGVAPTYEPNVGPLGGGGSWKFNLPAGGTAGSRIRTTQSTLLSTFNDRNYTAGCWVNFSQLPSGTNISAVPVMLASQIFTAGFGIYVGGASSSIGNNFSVTGAASPAIDTGIPCVANRWYFISVIVDGTSTKYYVDGVETNSITRTLSTNAAGLFFSGTNTDSNNAILNISNAFVAPANVITSTQLAEIYITGTSAQAITATATLVHPQINTQSDKVLSTQILSYSPEHYYKFDETPNFTTFNKPTNLGSYASGTGTWFTTNANSSTVILNSTGGARGTGGWQISYGGSSGLETEIRATTTQTTPWQDANFSLGYWFKTNFTLSDSLVHDTSYTITTVGVNLSNDRTVNTGVAGGGVNNSNKGKLFFTVSSGTNVYSDYRVDDQEWHYVAIRFDGNASGVPTEIYLDGVLINSQTTSGSAFGSNGGVLDIGEDGINPANNGSLELTSFEISDFYGGTYSSIGPTEIAILNAIADSEYFVPGVSVSHTAELMLGSASLPMPTIVAVIGDSVNISTSFAVSATFPTPAFSTGVNTTINADALTASGVLTDNYIITTDRDVEFGAEPSTAAALIVDPIVSRSPMTASATMPGGVASVAPNYFSLVKNLNPLYYIENGLSTPVNYGSWTVNGYSIQSFDFNIQSDEELNAVGNQKSWRAIRLSNADNPRLQGNITNYETLIEDLYATRNLSIEVWYWSVGYGFGLGLGGYQESGVIFDDGVSKIAEVYDWFKPVGAPEDPTNKIILISDKVKEYSFEDFSTATAAWRSYPDANPKREAWNHLVVTYEAVVDPNQIRRKVYLNGAIVGNEVMTISPTLGATFFDPTFKQNPNTFLGPNLGGRIQLSGSENIEMANGVKVDEFAIYPITLSGAQVLDHHAFIRSLSPDTEVNHTFITAFAEMGNHIVIPVQNTVYEVSPVSASGIVVQPTIIAGVSKNISAEPCTADAVLVDSQLFYGINYSAAPGTSFAESVTGYFLNDIYYEYVQANIAPYRYVTFDQQDSFADYGTDNDYSVIPTVVGGQIVQTDLGINGKSALTAGNNYATDGVILKESEWNDSWGTGQNSYHSAFWFQRSILDQSSTGLRVLWNLNGYKDNQHVVLYQYQNKLHIQFNNGSGTWIEQDSGTLDLFDYQRHFVVINFNHTNPNNNIVSVYVDAVLVMTINLGAYTGSTTNASSADSGANSEANNHPRLGVGCLITPFAATALPVVPTNTRLIIDEIYWDKNQVTPTEVTNLYNTLPGKTNYVHAASPMIASDEFVMPALSIGINQPHTAYEALAQIIEPTFEAQRNISNSADPMLADATITDVQRSDSINIIAEFMLASAFFNSAGTPRTIDADPLTATGVLQDRRIPTGALNATNYPIKINGISTFDPESAWVKYVRTSSVDTMNLMKEVN